MVFVNNVSGESVDVAIQDQTTAPVEYFLSRDLDTFTITSTTGPMDRTITVAAGHNIVPTNWIEIYSEDPVESPNQLKSFVQRYVVAVSTNDITLATFVGFDIVPENIIFSKRISINMNVNGSLVAPIRFNVGPPNGFKWDLTRTIIGMVLAASPDDGRFGDIAGGIANGIFFGFESDLGVNYLVDIRINAGFRGTAYDVNYVTRTVPAGSYGLSVRKTFAGPDKYGVAIRLDGETNDKFVMYVQDDLSTFQEFGIKVMGHHVEEDI